MNSEYENMRRVCYDADQNGTAMFVPVCEKCGRIVKADSSIKVHEWNGLADAPNATCSKHGRVKMLFEGFL